MSPHEIPSSEAFIIIEIIEFVPNSILTKTVLKKSFGNISLMSLDSGEALIEKISPFDSFIQIIEGEAEVVIDSVPKRLKKGQGIIIPAHRSQIIRAKKKFKMVLTIIKNGYEG